MRVALRTQQVIAHETGVTNTIDPLGGSYFVESLTDGWSSSPTSTSPRSTSSAGWSRRSSAATRSARSPTRRSSSSGSTTPGERKLVGVNSYKEGGEGEIEILRIDPALERKQIDRVQGVRARRDAAAVEAALAELKAAAAQDDHNLMPNLLDCARVHASEGEIVEALQTVFGTYTETPVF